MHPKKETKEAADMRSLHNKRKMLKKAYADNRRNPKEEQIQIGDELLIKPPFGPNSFRVTEVKGSQVKAKLTYPSETIMGENKIPTNYKL